MANDKSNEGTTASTSPSKVIAMRRIEPGDLLEVVRQIRRFMAVADTTAHLLYASYADIGADVQENAEKARRNVERVATVLYQLSASIEKSPIFIAMRKTRGE